VKKKSASQLFTFNEIVRNNARIFSNKQYPKGWNENDNHYICKVYLGESLKKYYPKGFEITYEYDGLGIMGTEGSPRKYIPDIFAFYINHDDQKIYIADVEINGKIHCSSKHQYNKGKWRRESITDYFVNYIDKTYRDYPIVFSYIVFETDEFLYNKLGYFLDIFIQKFHDGGRHPEYDAYEGIML
jgi:hypothetical protein